MNGWQEGDIETNGIRLHYTRTGGDKPALVMAHGVTDSGLCWAPVAQALAADYDVIMVDARAHGLSQETEGGFDPATQAEDLAGLITGLGSDPNPPSSGTPWAPRPRWCWPEPTPICPARSCWRIRRPGGPIGMKPRRLVTASGRCVRVDRAQSDVA